MADITIRVVEQRGRLRVRAADGKFVQCPNEWRATLAVGRVHVIPAKLRSDGRCYVFNPY